MRKLGVNTFVSLDGVVQAPGGPEKDPTPDDIEVNPDLTVPGHPEIAVVGRGSRASSERRRRRKPFNDS
jgi:hypothetical protein